MSSDLNSPSQTTPLQAYLRQHLPMTSPRIQTAIKAMQALSTALEDISNWPSEAANLRYQMGDQATKLVSQLNDLPRSFNEGSKSPPPPPPQVKEEHPLPNGSIARHPPAPGTVSNQLIMPNPPTDLPTNKAISTPPPNTLKRPSSSPTASPSPQIKKERTSPTEAPTPSNPLSSLFADRAARLEAQHSLRQLEEREEALAKTRLRQAAIAKDPAKAEQRKHAEAMKLKLAKEKEAKEMVKRRIERDRKEREARVERERLNRVGRTVVVEGVAKVREEKKVERLRGMERGRGKGRGVEVEDDEDDGDYERDEDDDDEEDDDDK